MAKALQGSEPAQVGIRELRANLSRLLEDVRDGRELVVTDRGKPVAKLVPFDAEADDPFADLIARGLVRPPLRPKQRAIRRGLPKPRGSVTELLLQEREEGW